MFVICTKINTGRTTEGQPLTRKRELENPLKIVRDYRGDSEKRERDKYENNRITVGVSVQIFNYKSYNAGLGLLS